MRPPAIRAPAPRKPWRVWMPSLFTWGCVFSCWVWGLILYGLLHLLP